jgi:hypothetical protein
MNHPLLELMALKIYIIYGAPHCIIFIPLRPNYSFCPVPIFGIF